MQINPLYAKCGGEFNTEYHHLTRPDIPSTLTSNTYELLCTSAAIYQEPVHNLVGTVDPPDEEMEYNPLYDKSVS